MNFRGDVRIVGTDSASGKYNLRRKILCYLPYSLSVQCKYQKPGKRSLELGSWSTGIHCLKRGGRQWQGFWVGEGLESLVVSMCTPVTHFMYCFTLHNRTQIGLKIF